mmetsp:Transcript_17689/g.44183  ORF Transcript_17689/g.44183 Transcript_17689/m.44183 type:complete len:327 (+) Transcript_17689:343-1323(+)
MAPPLCGRKIGGGLLRQGGEGARAQGGAAGRGGEGAGAAPEWRRGRRGETGAGERGLRPPPAGGQARAPTHRKVQPLLAGYGCGPGPSCSHGRQHRRGGGRGGAISGRWRRGGRRGVDAPLRHRAAATTAAGARGAGLQALPRRERRDRRLAQHGLPRRALPTAQGAAAVRVPRAASARRQRRRQEQAHVPRWLCLGRGSGRLLRQAHGEPRRRLSRRALGQARRPRQHEEGGQARREAGGEARGADQAGQARLSARRRHSGHARQHGAWQRQHGAWPGRWPELLGQPGSVLVPVPLASERAGRGYRTNLRYTCRGGPYEQADCTV